MTYPQSGHERELEPGSQTGMWRCSCPFYPVLPSPCPQPWQVLAAMCGSQGALDTDVCVLVAGFPLSVGLATLRLVLRKQGLECRRGDVGTPVSWPIGRSKHTLVTIWWCL